MMRSRHGSRLCRLWDTLSAHRVQQDLRPRVWRSPGVEPLEHRALMANITATGVLSAVADGPSFDYTVKLTNSAASSAAIGTLGLQLTTQRLTR